MAATRTKILLPALIVAALLVATVAEAPAKMVSKKLSPNVCQTTGGGRFVAIPDFPGERIDQRLLPDIAYLERRFKVFVTDGLSNDPVHAANGEHPIGLALDIVPNTAAGGTWRDITALAKWAEPTQDHPVAPFRWVGYNGDASHGRGNHLHLSWNHSETKPGVPAATVDTLRCPTRGARKSDGRAAGGKSDGVRGGKADGGGVNAAGGGKPSGGGGNGGKQDTGAGPSGGVGASGGGGSGSSSGGIGLGRIGAELERQARHPVIETGGVGIDR